MLVVQTFVHATPKQIVKIFLQQRIFRLVTFPILTLEQPKRTMLLIHSHVIERLVVLAPFQTVHLQQLAAAHLAQSQIFPGLQILHVHFILLVTRIIDGVCNQFFGGAGLHAADAAVGFAFGQFVHVQVEFFPRQNGRLFRSIPINLVGVGSFGRTTVSLVGRSLESSSVIPIAPSRTRSGVIRLLNTGQKFLIESILQPFQMLCDGLRVIVLRLQIVQNFPVGPLVIAQPAVWIGDGHGGIQQPLRRVVRLPGHLRIPSLGRHAGVDDSVLLPTGNGRRYLFLRLNHTQELGGRGRGPFVAGDTLNERG
mmetsp:Transcript_43874/g.93311  ORF Transcript_43874/g.93311 Transcript_43874/m.93311 type:complete len:310 (+) Transcript_43874:1400-2329(+)